jgi:hypothetical protein
MKLSWHLSARRPDDLKTRGLGAGFVDMAECLHYDFYGRWLDSSKGDAVLIKSNHHISGHQEVKMATPNLTRRCIE